MPLFETDVPLWYRTGKIGMNQCAQKCHNRTSILMFNSFNCDVKIGIMRVPGETSQMHIDFVGGMRCRAGRSGRRQERHNCTPILRYESSQRHIGFGRRGRFQTPVFKAATFLCPYQLRASGLYQNEPAIFLHPAAVMNA